MKDYREKELKYLVVANILVILIIIKMITFEGLIEQNSYMQLIITVINSGLFSSVIYAMVTVLDCMISSRVKKIIVFWWKPMPGATIFSDMKKGTKDDRFITLEVITKYADIYNNMPKDKKSCREYENSKWNKLLCRHESEAKVQGVHREYLMCRDMTTTTVVMLIVYVILSCGMKFLSFDWKAIVYLMIVYAVCLLAARVKAKRFVKTVIACDLNSKENDNDRVK